MTIDGQRAAVLWPPNYSATFTPGVTIFDEAGHEVATEGEELTTVMLGPSPVDQDACGLDQAIELYFDRF
jgi:hypothetical protein